MKRVVFIALSSLLTFLAHAGNQSKTVFQDQTPLPMKVPNEGKEQHAKWLPISPEVQEGPKKSTPISEKTVNNSIKTLLQKKMQTLLQPMDDASEH